MKISIKYIALLLIISIQAIGNDKYCIYFTDKNGSEFNPLEYFSNKGLSKQPKIDSADFPLNQTYVEAVNKLTGNISSTSRWLNAVIVKASSDEINTIQQLPFVEKVSALQSTVKLAKYKFKATLQTEAHTLMSGQVESMQGDLFKQNKIDGTGIRIAIFDAGFTGADKSPVFEHLRKNGQIVKTWDFVSKKEDVYAHNQHGTMVLSCLAGELNGERLGMATGAEYLLARTESNMETLTEEEYWMQAVEWAYKNGADIINSSLGYTYHRYFEKDMDGHTSLVAKAAAMAAEKGILVVNAMGNDGTSKWQTMCTPADVENVMAVGGIDPSTGIHIPFSSYGPTADKRMKPNVSAYAHVVTGSNKKLAEAYGTSFASPLVAGFAACVLQLNPDYDLQTLFDAIEKSGSLYPYFDYAHGYGIPQAGYFIKQTNNNTFALLISQANDQVKIYNGDNQGTLYYHIQSEKGSLEKYSVVDLQSEDTFEIPVSDLKGKLLRIHFNGETIEKQF